MTALLGIPILDTDAVIARNHVETIS